MKKACLFIASDINGLNNRPFLSDPEGEGMKNLLYPFIDLKRVLAAHNFDLSTRDINSPEESELVFYLDNPAFINQYSKQQGQVNCLIIYDPPIYVPESWDKSYHQLFDFVFTFDNSLVDNKKYFHYYFSIDTAFFTLPEIVSEEVYLSRKLLTFVSNSIHRVQDKKNPNSIIHQRYEVIDWFANNHPNEFGFYGGTFKKRNYFLALRGMRVIRKVVPHFFLQKYAKYIQRKIVRVFKGELGPLDKFKVIKQYNFYYCNENTKNINGYLTEKMFDCLYSGIVPIYMGAPNVVELVPCKCYIDGFQFKDIADLYKFIKKMPYTEYRTYLENARSFLQSSEMEKFTVSRFSKDIISPIEQFIKTPTELVSQNNIN